MHIHAAVARAPHAPLSFETLQLEALRDHEILVRLVATGICHTDIAMRDQAYPVPQPIVLGHEGAGVVQAVGRAVTKVKVGDPVVMSFNSCGQCPSCQAHAPSYCHDFFAANFAGQRPDGSTPLSRQGELVHGNFFGQSSFASHSVCTERNIVKVPRDVPLEMLGPLACGIQTGAGAIINSLRPRLGQSLVVFGAGSVGLSAIMAAHAMGITSVIAVDRLASRLDMARSLGASHVLQAGPQSDMVQQIRQITGAGADLSFETTGVMAVLQQAVQCLAPRGSCGFVGASPAGSSLAVDVTDFMTQGKSLHGIVEGDSQAEVFIPQLITLYQQGRFPFDRLIRYYPFEALNQAIEDAEAGRVIKAVVKMA